MATQVSRLARPDRHHVVIIGSGFGGLFAARRLAARADVAVTVISKTNHHLFQPLLYQVATGILSIGDVAPVTRDILRRQRNARVLLGLVENVDLAGRTVTMRYHDHVTEIDYDSLIVAAGAGQNYFGNDEFATFAPGMKSIDDALELRSRIYNAFELAEQEEDAAARRRLLTFVVVGAGPTGVEMAGQIRELASITLRGQFRRIEPADARVILVDAQPKVLPSFGEELGGVAKDALHRIGVETRLGAKVTGMNDYCVTVSDGSGNEQQIDTVCKVWAAGVEASHLGSVLADQSDAELDRSGRVKVRPDLTLPGHPDVFVVGDLMAVDEVPGMAQAAIQSGRYAADVIGARLDGNDLSDKPFQYKDKGSMAIIAKYRAVASIAGLKFTGTAAWALWLFVHLLFLVGFKSRLTTLLNWLITFVSDARGERATTNQQEVGRLALDALGQGVSGELLRGGTPTPGRYARRVHE